MIKVAIAEEHPLYLEGLCATIDNFEGFIVLLKEPTAEGLLQQMERGSVPDICVFDISMPTANGYEVLKKIKKDWPKVKVLLLSLFTNEMSIIRGLRIGANGFLLKSSDPVEMHKALRAVAERGYFYTDLVPHDFLEQPRSKLLLQLSYQEMEFLSLCCTEMTYKAIAEKMGVATGTIDYYRKSLYRKLSVNTRIGLVLFALNMGIKAL